MTKTRRDIESAEQLQQEKEARQGKEAGAGYYTIAMTLAGNIVHHTAPVTQPDLFGLNRNEGERVILRNARSGEVTYLTGNEYDIIRVVCTLLYDMRENAEVQEYIEQVQGKLARRATAIPGRKQPIWVDREPRIKVTFNVREAAKIIQNTAHPSGTDLRAVRDALYSLLDKVYHIVFYQPDGTRDVFTERDLPFLYYRGEKALTRNVEKKDKDGNTVTVTKTDFREIELELEDHFLYGFKTYYMWSPRDFFAKRKELGINTDMFNFLELLLSSERYARQKHAESNRKAAEKRLKAKAKLENRKLSDEDKKVIQAAYMRGLCYEITREGLRERIKRPRYTEIKRGEEKPKWGNFMKDLKDAVDALKKIGLILRYDDKKTDRGGSTVLRFWINPEYKHYQEETIEAEEAAGEA